MAEAKSSQDALKKEKLLLIKLSKKQPILQHTRKTFFKLNFGRAASF
jgi:hypothetical protein